MPKRGGSNYDKAGGSNSEGGGGNQCKETARQKIPVLCVLCVRGIADGIDVSKMRTFCVGTARLLHHYSPQLAPVLSQSSSLLPSLVVQMMFPFWGYAFLRACIMTGTLRQ